MKTLAELTQSAEPAIALIRDWVAQAMNPCELLPPAANRADVLLALQVSTHSTLGAMGYETGGLLIDGGWLRFLGSGHARLQRTLPQWNAGRADGFYLVADDAAGGFFAINGGAFGDDRGQIYYWSPDNLDWEPLEIGYTDFLQWALSSDLTEFYDGLRWSTWKEDIRPITGDRGFSFSPLLWTSEGSAEHSDRRAVPMHELFDLKQEILEQLAGPEE